MTAIKNIIFDYGGVILNIDFHKLAEAFHELGIENFPTLYSQALQNDFLIRFEKGEASPTEFYQFFRNISHLDLSDEQIKTAWNTILLDLPESRIRLLEKIRPHYRIFLLSNTNEIHYQYYTSLLKEKFGYHDLGDLFDKIYLSFQVGMHKPDVAFFELILHENNLIPTETLFIDDTYQHIEGANQAGLMTHFLSDGRDVTSLFEPKTGKLIPFSQSFPAGKDSL